MRDAEERLISLTELVHRWR